MRSRFSIFLSSLSAAVFLASLQGCSPALDGHVVGNGGDTLLARFESAREHALDALFYFEERRAMRLSRFEARDIAWLLERRSQLAAEIARLPFREAPSGVRPCVAEVEHGCACTGNRRGDTVWLVKEACNAIPTIAELGELVTHEALHHFLGRDEQQVYRRAALVYRVWNRFPEGTLPTVVRSDFSSDVSTAQASDGSVFVSWSPRREDELSLFTGAQRLSSVPVAPYTEKRPDIRTLFAYAPRDSEFIFFSLPSRYRFHYLSDWNVVRVNATTGLTKVLRMGRYLPWAEMAKTFAGHVAHRTRAVLHFTDSKGAPFFFDYDDALGILREIYAPEELLVADKLALSDDALYVSEPPRVGDRSLAVWRYARGVWARLPPGPVLGSPAVFLTTHQGLLVYGGTDEEKVFQKVGAIFKESEGTWRMIPAGGPGPANGRLLSVVVDKEVHLVGERWRRLSLRNNEWEGAAPYSAGLVTKETELFGAADGFLFWNVSERKGLHFQR